jgi:alkanesulfonate monooxygenase SsuD/methylene tetrahydromethanopterin reductase-like flavin-dependent oxidoreductase (luciferase family)
MPMDAFVARKNVMRAAAVAAHGNPDGIRLSLAGSPVVGVDRADCRERLRARSARRDLPAKALEEAMRARNVPHGTADQAGSRLADIKAAGVAHYYLQALEPLDQIDTDEIGSARRLLAQ